MTPCRTHLLSVIRKSRDSLVRESTEIVFQSADVPTPRDAVGQMLNACVALLEEGLAGESTDVRSAFLEALPDVAHTTTWDLTLKSGLPCWGIIIGKLVAATPEEHRDEAIVFLSRFMGAWWSDVSKVMLPVHIADGTL